MKRNIISTFLAVCAASAIILSCEPMEPDSYTENFYQIATVKFSNNKASLLMDVSGNRFYPKNFSTQTDMDRFEVKNGDRVIAIMTLYAVGNIANNELTVNNLYRYPTFALAESKPADSIYNYRYYLEKKTFNKGSAYTQLTYDKAWAQGHLVNFMPEYSISKQDVEAEFYLYPVEVNENNTLVMTLYSNIPDTLPAKYSDYSFVSFDLSTLRNQVADSIEQVRRDSILTKLERLNRDTINVEIHQPEIMRDLWKTSEGVIEKQYYNPRSYTTVRIPFDF